jgi:hypothetical protein
MAQSAYPRLIWLAGISAGNRKNLSEWDVNDL